MLKTAEAVALALIAAALLGVAAWGLQHKRAAHEAREQLAIASARAEACAASVALLESEAAAREAAAAKALAEAQAQADKYALRADRLLRQPAAVPGDDCASARVRARAWLEGRR